MLNPRLRRVSAAVWGGRPCRGTYSVPRRRTVARSAQFGCLVGHTARQPDMRTPCFARLRSAETITDVSTPKTHSYPLPTEGGEESLKNGTPCTRCKDTKASTRLQGPCLAPALRKGSTAVYASLRRTPCATSATSLGEAEICGDERMPPIHGGQRTQYANLARTDVESKSEEICARCTHRQNR